MKSSDSLPRFSQYVYSSALPVLLSLMLCGRVAAHQGTAPASAQQAGPLAAVQQLVLPATDLKAELKADAAETRPGPLRFAVPRKVNVSPATHGTWEQLPNGRLWRLRILSAGATDLNVGFTTYWLPEGATLYLMSESTAYYQGPYTAEHNAEHGQLWTAVVPGEAAVLELFVPTGVQQDPTLVLGQVGTGYRDLFKQQKDLSVPKGDTCEIDVVCPVAAPWTNEIRSVALISIGGIGFCSGTLIMDAAGDFRPFLLTANHCEISAVNAASVVAYWNYQSVNCGLHGLGLPSLTSWSQTTSGSSFRAAKADVDFCLIELTRNPNSAYAVYYAGWDRRGIATNSVVGIHHPAAEGKCISFSSGNPTTTDNCIGSGGTSTGTHWRVPWGSQGVTEGGSSGSGIWDTSTHRLVGTLSGGASYCGADPTSLWDCYGKFSLAWASGNSSIERLLDWLDPCNTGIMTTTGAYPTPHVAITTTGVSLGSEGCTPANGVVDPGETVTVNVTLKNVGTLAAANAIATLQSGSGVVAPSAPQVYGPLAVNGTPVSRQFSFTASGNCGDTITPILSVQDGASNYCTSFSLLLGQLTIGLAENFDTTAIYTLPAGWTESSPATWIVISGTADTQPNAIYCNEPPNISDRRLFSPVFPVTSQNAQLSFRHNYDTELDFDGCVLEISIGGGAFTDIQAAGGWFLAGGYDTTIATGFNSPIAGRQAWSGNSGGFITTTAVLPPGAAGQNVQLSWRLASDMDTGGTGWYVDTVSIASGYKCCAGSAAPPTLSGVTLAGAQFKFTVTGTTGSRYAVQTSTDLVHWAPVQTNASPFTFTLANPGSLPNRFYRAVSTP
ncbi:MAG TPA: hypothetical protein VJA21_27575 [Verrucomicrobiae bacterium]